MGKDNTQHARHNREPRHVRLYHSVTGCDAWADLSGNAVKLLVALARLDKGGDNGALFLGVRDAARSIGVAVNTAVRAFAELEDHGFIAAVDRGHFAVKGGPATTWRLTWAPAPHGRVRAPTRDFERWNVSESRSQKLTEMVPIFETAPLGHAGTVSNIDTAPAEKPLVPVKRPVSKTYTQLVMPQAGWSDEQSNVLHRGHNHGGPSLAELRDAVREQIARAGAGAQSTLAHRAKVPGATLSRFLAGGGLPAQHTAAVAAEVERRVIQFPRTSCEKCGCPVIGPGRGCQPKRFCSERCRKLAEHARRYQRTKGATM